MLLNDLTLMLMFK